MMKSLTRLMTLIGISAGLSLSIVLSSLPVDAAERVVLKYRIFRRSIQVEELSDLAKTGTVSPALRAHLRLANQDPNDLRQLLQREVPINWLLLDRILNTPVGDAMLDEMSKAIHTPSGEGSRQAMRSALVMSARNGNKIQMIEVLENYPTEAVHVDGDRLEETYQHLANLQRRWNRLISRFNIF
jgi:hypothetical protein